jgi:hypothetical protein
MAAMLIVELAPADELGRNRVVDVDGPTGMRRHRRRREIVTLNESPIEAATAGR